MRRLLLLLSRSGGKLKPSDLRTPPRLLVSTPATVCCRPASSCASGAQTAQQKRPYLESFTTSAMLRTMLRCGRSPDWRKTTVCYCFAVKPGRSGHFRIAPGRGNLRCELLRIGLEGFAPLQRESRNISQASNASWLMGHRNFSWTPVAAAKRTTPRFWGAKMRLSRMGKCLQLTMFSLLQGFREQDPERQKRTPVRQGWSWLLGQNEETHEETNGTALQSPTRQALCGLRNPYNTLPALHLKSEKFRLALL